MNSSSSRRAPKSFVYKSVILAGGASRRMGQDKALIPIGQYRLVDIVLSRLSSQCDEVLISGDKNYGLEVENIPDSADGPSGPVGGIYTLWQRFRDEDLDGFITVPIDGPNVPLDFCETMIGQNCAVSVTSDGVHPTFAYWNLSCLTRVFHTLDLKSSPALKSLASLCEARKVNWPDAHAFFNINTPHDFSEWEQSHRR